ncbi:MAG: TonB family protein [Opitutaceae bacterium]|nr:TonB family protein [Opitutaceae bacterium]
MRLVAALVLLHAFRIVATAASSPAEAIPLVIVLDKSKPVSPTLDLDPRVRRAEPVVVGLEVARALKPQILGRIKVELSETGDVTRVHVVSGGMPHDLEHLISEALSRWTFEPPVSGGRRTSTAFHAFIAPVLGEANRGPAEPNPPPAVFLVPPTYPHELRRMPDRSAGVRFGNEPTARSGLMRDPRTGQTFETTLTPTVPGNGPPTQDGRGENAMTPCYPGAVTVRFRTSESGTVVGPRVVQSTCSAFEPDAVAALLGWHFPIDPQRNEPTSEPREETLRFDAPNRRPPQFIHKHGDTRWDVPPGLRHLALPVYPDTAANVRTEGTARVVVHLSSTGRVTAIDTLDSKVPEFAAALRAAVQASVFSPARFRGKDVDAEFELTARFALAPNEASPDYDELPTLALPSTTQAAPLGPKDLDHPLRRIWGRSPLFWPDDISGLDKAEVNIEVTVDADGRVREPRIITSPQPALGFSAVQAVSTWLFEPPRAQGKPVPVRIRIPFVMSASATGR